MRPSQLISRFFIKLFICYGLFLVAWPALSDPYASAFRKVGTKVFRSFGPDGDVLIKKRDNPTRMLDSDLVQGNRKTRSFGTTPFGTRYQGYAPTAVLLSLILASPVTWKRRGWATVLGLILVHLWIAFALWLMLVDTYSDPNKLAMYELSPLVKGSLSYTTFVVTKSTMTRYFVPVFFWILVTFRRDDWQIIVATPGTRDESS